MIMMLTWVISLFLLLPLVVAWSLPGLLILWLEWLYERDHVLLFVLSSLIMGTQFDVLTGQPLGTSLLVSAALYSVWYFLQKQGFSRLPLLYSYIVVEFIFLAAYFFMEVPFSPISVMVNILILMAAFGWRVRGKHGTKNWTELA